VYIFSYSTFQERKKRKGGGGERGGGEREGKNNGGAVQHGLNHHRMDAVCIVIEDLFSLNSPYEKGRVRRKKRKEEEEKERKAEWATLVCCRIA